MVEDGNDMVEDGNDIVSRVCFIGATGRSGSTLVSRVLGSLPGCFSVGELCWVWTYGVLRNRPCGCGEPFLECPFWTGVGKRAYGGWDQVDAVGANDLRRRVTRNGRIPELLVKPLGRTAEDVDEYVGLLAPLYAAITSESGGAVIVDNSKQPEVALLARRTPGVDLSVLHLVRRSHGVAYSWTKHVTRSDKAGREMLRRAPSRTAAAWLVDNALFETIGRTGTPRLQLRYEDFVAAPRARTREVSDFLGLDIPEDQMPFRGDTEVVLAADHSVWGNPMRLQTGVIPMRPDEGWRSGLPADQRRTVSAISWPGLMRYGYLR
ncbi:hypothetical protein ACT8ZV_03135 [Nocardioides sp. MAHUQ-72]|uniref:hypothetical protein n=1 Tax=unclassified Nocardioides TaxID=2615069 RepID=UPI0036216835